MVSGGLMSDVVRLWGGVSEGSVVPDVVEILEELLERAKAGELQALAFATVNGGGALGTGWNGNEGTRDVMGASISLLQSRYFLDAYRGDD